MAKGNLPTASEICQRLDYNPETGIFIRKHLGKEFFATTWAWSCAKRYMGKAAGSPSNYGYIQIAILGGKHQAHRLAWLVSTGDWPVEFIDHINGVRSDNSIRNLRAATSSQNNQNTLGSKYTGTSWHKVDHKWRASIQIDGKSKHLGNYSCRDEAAEAYRKAKLKLHAFSPEVRES